MIRSQKFWVAVALLVIIGSAVWSYLTLRFWDSGSTVNITMRILAFSADGKLTVM